MNTLTITRQDKPTLDQRWMVRRMNDSINIVDRILMLSNAITGGNNEDPRMYGSVEPDGRSIVVLEFSDDASEEFIGMIQKYVRINPKFAHHTLTDHAEPDTMSA